MLNIISNQTSPQELLSIFPDAKYTYILPKYRKIESEIKKLEVFIKAKLKRAKQVKDGYILRELILGIDVGTLIELKKESQRLRRYFPQAPSKGRVDPDRVNRAKQYPILQLATEGMMPIKKSGRAYRSLCPYHKEKTPSFYLYPEDNTFHCFGCASHGDVIALAQHLRSLNFIESVKYLSPYEN